VSPHRSAPVQDPDDVPVDPDADEFPSEDPSHAVPGAGEEDPAVAVHLAQSIYRISTARGLGRAERNRGETLPDFSPVEDGLFPGCRPHLALRSTA